MDNVDKALDAYIAAWNAMDFAALEAFWDHNEPEIYYVAEEMEHALHSLDDVVAYWELTAQLVESVEMVTTERRLKSLTESLCISTYEMHMNAAMQGAAESGSKPIGVDVRVSAIWKQSNHRWRLIHYVEAPLGALPFVRRAYNANVR